MAKLTRQQQQTIAIAAMVVIGGGYVYWNYMLKPTLEDIRTRSERHKQLLAEIETAEIQARRLPALQNELAVLQLDLSSLEKQLPKDRDVPNIIRTLTREALQENLQFSSLSPKSASKQQYFDILPFELKFIGTLHAFIRFLASLGQQDRIFQAQNISLTPNSGSPDAQQGIMPLNISFTIQTYAYSG
jgi:type IV pilus assembly protein PilO